MFRRKPHEDKTSSSQARKYTKLTCKQTYSSFTALLENVDAVKKNHIITLLIIFHIGLEEPESKKDVPGLTSVGQRRLGNGKL